MGQVHTNTKDAHTTATRTIGPVERVDPVQDIFKGGIHARAEVRWEGVDSVALVL